MNLLTLLVEMSQSTLSRWAQNNTRKTSGYWSWDGLCTSWFVLGTSAPGFDCIGRTSAEKIAINAFWWDLKNNLLKLFFRVRVDYTNKLQYEDVPSPRSIAGLPFELCRELHDHPNTGQNSLRSHRLGGGCVVAVIIIDWLLLLLRKK